VKLDEETLARVQAIFKSFDGERKVLHLAKRDTMKAIRDLIRNDSEDQESYATLLLAAKQAHNALAQLRTEEFAQLSGVLTPKQQALLMMSLQKLKRKMMGMRGKRGKRGGEGHRGPRHRRGLDNEGGGYGPPPHRGFGSRGGRSSGVDEVDDDLLDL
jgi:Spy/CpxP family protein refolding chaperone